MPHADDTTSRDPLTRDAVVRAAVARADEVGLAKLSMRSLAGDLRVEAMSLYHHVANKNDLLDGMVDAVFAEIHAPAPATTRAGWRDELGQRCRSARAVLLAHPWAVGLLDSRSNPGPATLAHHDAVLGCCFAAGFDVPTTGHIVATLDAYVFGFVLQELSLPAADGDGIQELTGDLLEAMGDQFPHLARFAVEQVRNDPGYAFAQEFEPGLALVLDAVAGHDPNAAGST